MRARVLFVSKDRVKTGELTSYEDLTKPEFRGRICVRSGKHVYNISLFASIIAHKGEAFVRTWLNGLKSNLARKPSGNDRAQAKAIYSGQCDIAIANTYYMGKMQTNKKKVAQRKWAASIKIVFPNQKDRGTHVNVSGGAITKGARNLDNAVKLLEFLSGDYAQKFYAGQNFEYPLKTGVATHPLVKSWGKFKADEINLATVANFRKKASKLVDLIDFNNFKKSSRN
jgi:iron(III) transport system substrate-binding protein